MLGIKGFPPWKSQCLPQPGIRAVRVTLHRVCQPPIQPSWLAARPEDWAAALCQVVDNAPGWRAPVGSVCHWPLIQTDGTGFTGSVFSAGAGSPARSPVPPLLPPVAWYRLFALLATWSVSLPRMTAGPSLKLMDVRQEFVFSLLSEHSKVFVKRCHVGCVVVVVLTRQVQLPVPLGGSLREPMLRAAIIER